MNVSKGRWTAGLLARKFSEFLRVVEEKFLVFGFLKLDGTSGGGGVSLPGKLAVLVRGDFQSASWKTAQGSTYE